MSREIKEQSILILNGNKDEQVQLRTSTSVVTLTTSHDQSYYTLEGKSFKSEDIEKHITCKPTILVNVLDRKSLATNFGKNNNGGYNHTEKEQEVHNMFNFDLVLNVVVIENVTLLMQDDLLIATNAASTYHLEESKKVKTLVVNGRDVDRGIRYALTNISEHDTNNVFIYSEFMSILTKVYLKVEDDKVIQNSLVHKRL